MSKRNTSKEKRKKNKGFPYKKTRKWQEKKYQNHNG